MTDLTNDREVAALLKKLPDDSGFPDPFTGMKTPGEAAIEKATVPALPEARWGTPEAAEILAGMKSGTIVFGPKKKLYRVRVQAEVLAVFEVSASSPDDAALKTFDVEPKSMVWLTAGRVVAIEEKTPEGWKATSPDEQALIRAFDSAQDAINAEAGQ